VAAAPWLVSEELWERVEPLLPTPWTLQSASGLKRPIDERDTSMGTHTHARLRPDRPPGEPHVGPNGDGMKEPRRLRLRPPRQPTGSGPNMKEPSRLRLRPPRQPTGSGPKPFSDCLAGLQPPAPRARQKRTYPGPTGRASTRRGEVSALCDNPLWALGPCRSGPQRPVAPFRRGCRPCHNAEPCRRRAAYGPERATRGR
jgi:hypothetical protein